MQLNGDGQPMRHTSAKRAIALVERGKAVVLKGNPDGRVLTSVKIKIPVPSVIMLREYHNVPYGAKWSKHEMFKRDKFTCQYCGKRFKASELTVDHVMPVSRLSSRSAASTWGNTVAACRKCNGRKANKTPEEAGMKLLSYPKAPRGRVLVVTSDPDTPQEWKEYFHLKD